MLSLPEFQMTVPPCILCSKELEGCAIGGRGYPNRTQAWITYECTRCVIWGIQSNMSLEYQALPINKLEFISITIDDIMIESNYVQNHTKIQRVKPSPDRYANKVILDFEQLISFENAISFDFSSKESVQQTIMTYLVFQ